MKNKTHKNAKDSEPFENPVATLPGDQQALAPFNDQGCFDHLSESERYYQFFFQHNPFPGWIFDLENLQFLDVNEAAVEFYGYSKEEFLSMKLADIGPKEEIPFLEEQLKRTGQNFDYPVGIRLREAGHADMLEVEAMFTRERRLRPSEFLQHGHRIVRNNFDVVEVVRGSRKLVVERRDEAAETVDCDGQCKYRVEVRQERPPGSRQFRRRSGERRASSRSGGSSAGPRLTGAPRANVVRRRAWRLGTTYLGEPADYGPVDARDL